MGTSPAHAAEPSTVNGGEVSWGYKQSFRNYVGRQIAAMAPIGALPVGERITVDGTAQFDDSVLPADEMRPYLFPVTGGSVTDEDNLIIAGAGKVSFHFPSHCFDATIGNPTIVIDGGAASLRGDVSVTVEHNTPGVCDEFLPGTYGGTDLLLSSAEHTTTLAANGTSATVALTGLTMSAEVASVMQGIANAGDVLDNLTVTVALEPAGEPAPEPQPTEPTLTVSKVTGLDASGEKITVSGAGYDPAIPMYLIICNDVPIDAVDFTFAMGCTAGSQQITNNPKSPTMVKLEDDGTFTTEFTAQMKASFADGAALYTLANHENRNNRTQDVKQSLAFSPLLTATPSTGLNPEGDEVTVTGLGYDPAIPMYLILCRDVPLADVDFELASSCAAGAKLLTNNPTRPSQVKLEDDGSFITTFTVKNSAALAGGAALYTVADHSAPTERGQDARRPISFTGPKATSLTAMATPSSAVEGTRFSVKTTVTPATAGKVELTIGTTKLASGEVSAAGEGTLEVSSLSAGSHKVKATFTPANSLLYSGSDTTIDIVVTAKSVAAGSFTWGVKQSFRDYVTGPIAAGSISTTNARSTGSAFVFGQASGSTFNGTTGTSKYSGAVRFTGHGGILDLRLANPVVRVDSANSATLLLSVNGSTVPFATLALASGSKSTSNGAVTYSRVPASLTAQGASAFVNGDSQFYPAGTALDPVTFTIGSPSSAGGGTATVAAFVAVANGVPPTPPASSGISVQGASPDSVLDGDEITITADGFEPNEQDIKVVIYSDPVILATDAAADAGGTVTWTGSLPSGLTGEHTLTLQGSVDRGIVLTIAERTMMMTTRMAGCVVSDATITWGFKEAFRSYVSGAIAHGEWTVSDGATYDIPDFGWSEGTGNVDPQGGEGLLAFTGAVTFTGHGGVLGTTISNPQLRFDDAETATLLLDVAGDTRDGVAVNQPGVEFATIDLGAAETTADAGEHTITAAPAVLTADGSAAFGTYEPGTELDPITITYTTDADCAAPVTAPTEDGEPLADSSAGPGWLLWVIIAAALAAIAALVWALVARRRRQN